MLHDVHTAVPNANVSDVLVQPMVAGGVETIVGMTRDPLFGPLVMFGLGGVSVEALQDVVFRIAPLGVAEAADMLDGIRGARILDGMRGRPAVNKVGLAEVLCRVSQLALDFPDIQELDLNPVLAFADHIVVVDARVRLGRASVEKKSDIEVSLAGL
jgi:acetyltransferase